MVFSCERKNVPLDLLNRKLINFIFFLKPSFLSTLIIGTVIETHRAVDGLHPVSEMITNLMTDSTRILQF